MNKLLLEESKAFIALPINQSVANFNPQNPDAPCCVGARLAQFMQVEGGFREGTDAFAKALGGNRAHLILMLRGAGAGEHPFSEKKWDVDPIEIWENLSKIDFLPNLTGANLTDADLYDADLREADLRRAKMTGAELTGAKMIGAYLFGAKLTGAKMIGADLTGADFSDANLTGAKMIGADLTGADFSDANLTGADFSDANLTDANLTGAKAVPISAIRT